MPRPPSGNPQWEAVAVKLPPELLARVRRHADLYHKSISTLIREGLEKQLGSQEVPSAQDGQPALPPATVAMLRQLALTLTTAAAEVSTICQERPGTRYNGYISTRESEYNGYTSTREEAYNSNTFMVTPAESALETFPERSGSRQLDHEQVSPTPRPLDAADLDAIPLEAVAMPQQPAEPPVSPRVSTLGDKAAVLAQLAAWKAAGLSLQKMADHLNAAQVPTFSGKGRWMKGTIFNLMAAQRQAAPVA